MRLTQKLLPVNVIDLLKHVLKNSEFNPFFPIDDPKIDSEQPKRGPRSPSSSVDKKVNDSDGHKSTKTPIATKAHLVTVSILAAAMNKAAPASVKRARIQALSSKTDAKKANDETIQNQSNDRESIGNSSNSKLNRRSSNASSPIIKVILNGKTFFKCDECDYMNYRRSRLSKHKLDHRERPFNCEICPRKFSDQDLLKMHLKVHRNKCSKCGKRFSIKEKWEEHEKGCKTTLLECDFCGFAASNKYKLKIHMRNHTKGFI